MFVVAAGGMAMRTLAAFRTATAPRRTPATATTVFALSDHAHLRNTLQREPTASLRGTGALPKESAEIATSKADKFRPPVQR